MPTKSQEWQEVADMMEFDIIDEFQVLNVP